LQTKNHNSTSQNTIKCLRKTDLQKYVLANFSLPVYAPHTMSREETGKVVQGPNISGYELTKPAQEVVMEYARQRGMLKKVIVERVMEFFARQPSFVKRVMIGDIDEGTEESYATLLNTMAESVREARPRKAASPAPRKRGSESGEK
jgi:hypothetical protein